MVAAQLKWFESSFTTCPVETLQFSGSELTERNTQGFQAKKSSSKPGSGFIQVPPLWREASTASGVPI